MLCGVWWGGAGNSGSSSLSDRDMACQAGSGVGPLLWLEEVYYQRLVNELAGQGVDGKRQHRQREVGTAVKLTAFESSELFLGSFTEFQDHPRLRERRNERAPHLGRPSSHVRLRLYYIIGITSARL